MATSRKLAEPTTAHPVFALGVSLIPAQRLNLWTRSAQRNWAGCVASCAVHLAAIGIAALIGISLPTDSELPILNSTWSAEDIPVPWVASQTPEFKEAPADAGGQSVESVSTLLDHTLPAATTVERPLQTDVSPLDITNPVWTTTDLLAPAAASGKVSGQGTGSGTGDGDNAGFFGLTPKVGQKIVFVVDNSRSMNHPHDSEAKTRFRRLKVELIQSIWQMTAEQQFYVIFFNKETYAMPSVTMQSATAAAKEKYLSWVATMDANGAPTDPRKAMELALSFQPDVVYFLTDGEFDKIVNRKLLRIKQPRTTIHTFAFGQRIGEAVLQDVARNNHGQYTFIP